MKHALEIDDDDDDDDDDDRNIRTCNRVHGEQRTIAKR